MKRTSDPHMVQTPTQLLQGSNHGLHVCVCLEPGGGGVAGMGFGFEALRLIPGG